MNNLLRHNLANKNFVFFDFETESLSLFAARGWDIGWSLYKGTKLIEEHQYFLKWDNLKVSDGAAKVTGFNQSNVDVYGKNPKEICNLFDSFIYNKNNIIIGANIIHYDIFIHNNHRQELGYKTDYSYLDRIIDTNAISKAYKLGIKPPVEKEDFIPFQYRMLNFKQKGLKTSNSTMAKEFGIEIDETKIHGAAYDVFLTKEVFFKLVQCVELIDYDKI